MSDLTVRQAPCVQQSTLAKQYEQHTQANVQDPKQNIKSTQYGVQLTANGELNMNLKKLKTPSVKLKNFVVGLALATSTAMSVAP